MSQTTYYEFNKPIGSDLVNPLTDTFPNWDIADSALHELNERSVANCTEVVSLGVHAISRLNTDTKFLKWIATANFTAGDTFTVDGNVVAAATASGEALSTGAYVTGAVILACLNADDSAMTVYVTGTNVASDSAKLGGELPSYYATEADMSNAQNDITNIQNLEGNTSIVGIGDGTLTGAVSAINSDLPDLTDVSDKITLETGFSFPVNRVFGKRFGKLVKFSFYISTSGSIAANTDVLIGILDSAINPANDFYSGTVTVVNGTNGNPLGYGSIYVKTNGQIRLNVSSVISLASGTFGICNIDWFIN